MVTLCAGVNIGCSYRAMRWDNGTAKELGYLEEDMREQFRKGDKVVWNTSQGSTEGTVVRKQTTPTKIKDHEVKASKSNPEYIVESSKSGKRAAHKPDGLRKSSD